MKRVFVVLLLCGCLQTPGLHPDIERDIDRFTSELRPTSTETWTGGPLILFQSEFRQLLLDETGIHCSVEENDAYWETQARIRNGTLLHIWTECEIRSDPYFAHFSLTDNGSSLDGLLAPGIPPMDVPWYIRVQQYGWMETENGEVNMLPGQPTLAIPTSIRAKLESRMPGIATPTLTLEPEEFCDGGTKTVTFHLESPSNETEGFIDFAPSTPVATSHGALDGTFVRFELVGTETSIQVEVAPEANPFNPASGSSCLAPYEAQQWSGEVKSFHLRGTVALPPVPVAIST